MRYSQAHKDLSVENRYEAYQKLLVRGRAFVGWRLLQPNEKLPMMHHLAYDKRLVVLAGVASLYLEGCGVHVLYENESIVLTIGQVYSIENCGKIPLELLEIDKCQAHHNNHVDRFADFI